MDISNTFDFMFKNIACILLFISGVCQTSIAQNNRISDHNTIAWISNTATIKMNNKWGIHTEYQWRREELFTNWQQSLLRLGINYTLNDKLLLRGGFGWIETYNYGDYPLQAAGKQFPEFRFFQAAQLTDKSGQVEILHRFMLEQRWLGRYLNPQSTKADDFVFLNRFRYMFRMQMPFKRKQIINKFFYAALYDEMLIGFGKNVGDNVFDQNRLGILLGYRFNNKVRVEGGFFSQIVQLGRRINGNSVFQYNNGIIINTLFNIDASGKNK